MEQPSISTHPPYRLILMINSSHLPSQLVTYVRLISIVRRLPNDANKNLCQGTARHEMIMWVRS